MQQKQLVRLGFPLLSLILLSLSVWAIADQLKKYDYREILNSLGTIGGDRLLLSLIFTILNYLFLTGYDILGCRYVRHPLRKRKIVLAAFIGHALGNSVGIGLLTGSAIRFRFYSAWGLSPVQSAQVIAFSNISFWLGIIAVGGVAFLRQPLAIPSWLNLPFDSAYLLGLIFLTLVGGYFIGSFWLKKPLRIRKWRFTFPSFKLALAQMAIASLDWILAGAVLYVLLPPSIPLSFPAFFSAYLIAQMAGIISPVPGGLGVFETIILLMLSSTIPSNTLFAALLIYRVIYFLLPLGVAVLLLSVYELWQRKRVVSSK